MTNEEREIAIRRREAMEKNARMTVEFMFESMPESKIQGFKNACYRNYLLTSWYGLGFSTLTVYKEGFYIEFTGCRSSFVCWLSDNDGELVAGRRPRKEKLHKLWSWGWMNEMPIDPYQFDREETIA